MLMDHPNRSLKALLGAVITQDRRQYLHWLGRLVGWGDMPTVQVLGQVLADAWQEGYEAAESKQQATSQAAELVYDLGDHSLKPLNPYGQSDPAWPTADMVEAKFADTDTEREDKMIRWDWMGKTLVKGSYSAKVLGIANRLLNERDKYKRQAEELAAIVGDHTADAQQLLNAVERRGAAKAIEQFLGRGYVDTRHAEEVTRYFNETLIVPDKPRDLK